MEPIIIKDRDFKTEREFQSVFTAALKEKWIRYYKLPDTTGDWKPFDIIACWQWHSIAIELKIIEGDPTYERCYKQLRENQVGWLYNHMTAGGLSYVVVYSKKEKTTLRFTFRVINDNIWEWPDGEWTDSR